MHRILGAICPTFPEGIDQRFGLFIDKTNVDNADQVEIEIVLVQQTWSRYHEYHDTVLRVAKLDKIESTLVIWRGMFYPVRSYAIWEGEWPNDDKAFQEEVSWVGNLADPDHIILDEKDNTCDWSRVGNIC